MTGEGVLVSIITPVFNSAKFIERTIYSVLNQTYTNWELILIDGGSKDDSLRISEKYVLSDERIKLLHNVDDKGPAHARYTGIKNSSGKYIAFLDGDDIWHPQKLALQVGSMEKESFTFTYTLCRELQQNCEYVSVLLPTKSSFSYKQYLKQRGIYAFTVVINRELLSDDIISIWNKDAFDDTLWWILIMRKGVIARLIPYDLGLYRLSPSQLSSRRKNTIKKVYLMYDYFSELTMIQKNISFVFYFINSLFRHIQLKLLPKKKLSTLPVYDFLKQEF